MQVVCDDSTATKVTEKAKANQAVVNGRILDHADVVIVYADADLSVSNFDGKLVPGVPFEFGEGASAV